MAFCPLVCGGGEDKKCYHWVADLNLYLSIICRYSATAFQTMLN